MYFPELSGLGKAKKPRMEKRTSPTGVNYWVPVEGAPVVPRKKPKKIKLKGKVTEYTTYSSPYFNKARQLSPARTDLINKAELVVQQAASQLGLSQDQYALAVNQFYKKGGDWPFGLDSFNFIRQSLYALGDFYAPVLTNEERQNMSKWLISMRYGIPFDQVSTSKATVSTAYESAGYGPEYAEAVAQVQPDLAMQHQMQAEAQAQQSIQAAQVQVQAAGDLRFATGYAEQHNNNAAKAIGSFASTTPQFLMVTRDSSGKVTLTPTTYHPGHYYDLNSATPEAITSGEVWALEEERSKLFGKPVQFIGPPGQERPEPEPQQQERTKPPEPAPQTVASSPVQVYQEKPWAAQNFKPVGW
jgi:hypothetical protein